MTRAYQETYLSRAQAVLGDAFDYAVNTCGIPGEDFVKLFLASTAAKRMENGEPAIVAGKSGFELAEDILLETTGKPADAEPEVRYDRSIEYWIGWAAGYFQWYSCRPYSDIFAALSFEGLQRMYVTFHEADVSRFAEAMEARLQTYFKDTNLKRIRKAYGCSQSELSALSGVTLRSIQMYEQRNKDINKASMETVYRLAKALGCTAEDLMER